MFTLPSTLHSGPTLPPEAHVFDELEFPVSGELALNN